MEFVEKFGIAPISLLAQIVNFTILLVLLRIFLYKPFLKILEERKQKVDQSIKNTETIEKRLAKTEEEQARILEKAKTEANKLIAEAKTEAKALAENTLVEAKKTATDMLQKNEKRMALEKDEMMGQVRKEVAELITIATAKVAGKSITDSDNKAMVESMVKELENK